MADQTYPPRDFVTRLRAHLHHLATTKKPRFTGRMLAESLAEIERLQSALHYVVRTYMVSDESPDPHAAADRTIARLLVQCKPTGTVQS